MEWKKAYKREFRHVVLRWDSFLAGRSRFDLVEEVISSILFSEIPDSDRAANVLNYLSALGMLWRW